VRLRKNDPNVGKIKVTDHPAISKRRAGEGRSRDIFSCLLTFSSTFFSGL
jgi:hypothetical protein